jgi:hypothetical protein
MVPVQPVAKFEVSTAMKIQIEVLQVVTPYTDVVKMEAGRSSGTVVSHHIITLHHNPDDQRLDSTL